MGLTIHYSLQSRPRTTKTQAHDIVILLQEWALSLLREGLLAQVSEVYAVTEETLKALIEDRSNEWNWAAVQSYGYVRIGQVPYTTLHQVTPIEGFLLRTWPGPGSEAANFGLMRYPKRIEIESEYA